MGPDRSDDLITEARLREIYSSTLKRRPHGCPSPEALQALARREGDEAERLATLDHAMSCVSCRTELDLLLSIERAGAELGAAASRRMRGRAWLAPAALAATVLLAVGVGRTMLDPGGDEILRSAGEAGTVTVLAPSAEAPAGEPLTFTWRPVDQAVRYRVEVMGAGGELAVEAETRDTAVTLDAVRRLAPGDYRWWVMAMTPAPGPRSSLRSLRLTPR